MANPSIAIVVPTLNEEDSLESCLSSVVDAADRLVVSDGGSRDLTLEIARDVGAQLVEGPPSRGTQLNAGASACREDGFLFLHADTILPEDGIESVRRALADGAVGGGFLIRFDARAGLYRFGSAMVNLRTRATRLPLGDQAQFVSRNAFETLGGFSDWPILEDLDFIRRLRRLGKVRILSPAVTTSSRRFERYGPVRTFVNNWLIFALFALGVSPHRLRRLYPATSKDRAASNWRKA